MAYIIVIRNNFNLNLFLKNIIVINTKGIIGLIKVEGEKDVPKKFLNIKLDISKIGKIIINTNNEFVKYVFFNLFLLACLYESKNERIDFKG